MQDHGASRFCSSCKHQVIDYVNLTNQAFDAVVNSGELKGCGRFRTDQLHSVLVGRLSAFTAAAFLLISAQQASAGMSHQNIMADTLLPSKLITGRVTASNGQPLAGVSLRSGNDAVTVTDTEGNFQLPAIGSATAIITTHMPGYLRQARSYHPAMGATEFNFVLQSKEEAWPPCIVMGMPVITEFKEVEVRFTAKQMDPTEEMKMELALLAAQLRQFPMTRLNIVASASSPVQRATARTRINQLIAILSDEEGISAGRIYTQVEKYGEGGLMRLRIVQ